MFTDALAAEFVDFRDETVQEVAVMADDDEGAVKVDERLLVCPWSSYRGGWSARQG